MERTKQRTFGYEEKGKIAVNIYKNLRSTGAQLARLYELAMIHRKETPLRPVLSVPRS